MKDNKSSISRRKFLGSVGCGVAGTVVATTMIGCAKASESEASSISMPDSGHISQTMLKLAKDIYPHEMLENKYYQKIVDDLAKQEKKLIGEGIAMLDQLSIEKLGQPFLNVGYEPDRIRVLRSIEDNPFFIKVRTALMFGIYDNKDLFHLFGYQGSSWEKGGYIDRGLNELDWLND
ncbi:MULTISPECIES: transcriptional initiation protein Tat [Colwellia]|uniref:Tat (Twin-arginine translocation) pathway signal sequence domain protein n=1 Tax=Colwellia psychrerythraea (strain 34H / ATCC BAA-681) TaxID=167879 RepID=Q47ZL8_COLP3|nr:MULTISPECIES: transcriptional initiation protein Tat [Colwellia]AAZ25461.1 tat (twin-arginine translocation) pathway signal sequence domain protein [Colwellia psychrerythraea 34H]PKH87251.1 transcriptional initiation protein Tat [Colwellia sp. Bg11-28]